MLPKEHGAYGQMAVPLVTAFLVAGVSVPALLLAAAVVSAFLAHEPLLVVLGRRGVRARRDDGRRATAWLAACGAAGIAAGVLALVLAPPMVRQVVVVPLLPAAVVAGAIAVGREKSDLGEVAAGIAFALVVIPVCLAAGTSVRLAVAVALPFVLMSAGQVLAVRSVIARVRGGGNAAAAHALGRRAVATAVIGAIALGVLAWRGTLPWFPLVAALPGAASSMYLTFFPPPPSRLRTVGWALVSTALTTAVIIVAAARF